jgi:cation transport protein ChaC
MRSIHHRGTEADPGLVLALDADPAGFCDGVALRVVPGQEAATLTALRKRELISSAYLERYLPIRLQDGRTAEALAFVIDPDHVQYCGGQPLEEQAQIIAQAVGGRGANRDYLFATASHLADLGIADPDLQWLADRVQNI